MIDDTEQTITRIDAKDAARDLKKELKAAFPGTTFRVTSKWEFYHPYIYVSWSKGPCYNAVSAIAEKYRGLEGGDETKPLYHERDGKKCQYRVHGILYTHD